jgi:hypothetical protein
MRTLRLVDAKNETKKIKRLKGDCGAPNILVASASSLRDAIPLLHILSLPKSQ